MTPTDDKIICLNCGYDLRGTPGDKCSECGTSFDRVDYKHSLIPWERASYGAWRFPMTMIATTFWKKRMRADVHREHKLQSAKRFSFYVAVFCVLPWVAIYTLVHFSENISQGLLEIDFRLENSKTLVIAGPNLHIGEKLIRTTVLLLGMALKDLLGYFVGVFAIVMWTLDWVRAPGAVLVGLGRKAIREGSANQASVAAMGHYLSGPMALIGLFFWIGMGIQIALDRMNRPSIFNSHGETELVIGLIVTAVPMLSSAICCYCLVERLYQLNVAFFQPRAALTLWTIFWLILTFLARGLFWLLLIPCFIGFIRIIVESLIWAR